MVQAPMGAWLLAAGYQFLVIALRSGAEFSVIGSFRYASILWALGIGYVVWGDIPNALAWGGIALLVAAGLGMLRGQRLRSRAALDAATD